jgi:hypothetical protein
VLSGPSWASDGVDSSLDAEDKTPTSQTLPDEVVPEKRTPPPQVRTETPYWDFDYQRGLRTSRVGTKMGTVGLFSVLGGVGLFAVGLSTNGGELGIDSARVLPLSGLVVAGLGLLVIQVGAPVAAMGTFQSHRALVQGGQTARGCGTCVAAMALSVPNPISLFTVPWSYTMSSEQRRTDRIVYHRHKGWPPPSVKMSRTGLGLSGQF